MHEEMEQTMARGVDYTDQEIGEDLDPAARWIPVALQFALSKSDREKRTC